MPNLGKASKESLITSSAPPVVALAAVSLGLVLRGGTGGAGSFLLLCASLNACCRGLICSALIVPLVFKLSATKLGRGADTDLVSRRGWGPGGTGELRGDDTSRGLVLPLCDGELKSILFSKQLGADNTLSCDLSSVSPVTIS